MKAERILAIVLLLASPQLLQAITLNSLDTFATTTENWVEGGPSPNPPTWNGGPGYDGVTAGYLIDMSDGNDRGGKQLMWNTNAEWQGNYIAAGVTGVLMWVDNRSGIGSNLNLRIGFYGNGGWFASNAKAILDTSAGNEWVRLNFKLDSSNFTWISGTGGTHVFNDTMTSVTKFEIFVSATLPTFGYNANILEGDNIVSDIRYDSIGAIPEPNPAILFGAMGFTIFYWRLRCVSKKIRLQRSNNRWG